MKAVHWFHVPNHVLTIPSGHPAIPGIDVSFLLGLIGMHGVVGEVTVAFYNGINSAYYSLHSLGVAVPNIFARRYIAKDRQKFPGRRTGKEKGEGGGDEYRMVMKWLVMSDKAQPLITITNR